MGRLTGQISDIPPVRLELFRAARFRIRAGCRAYSLSADNQINAGLPWIVAAADQERDIFMRDLELGRSKLSCRDVAAGEAVHQTLTPESCYFHLSRQSPFGWALAKGCPRGFPVAVGVALEDGE